MNEAICKALIELAVPANLSGYSYLIRAIKMCIENEMAIRGVTKNLYPAIASAYGINQNRVERAIRHAIECSFQNVPTDIERKYFGNIAFPKGHPTNSQYIAAVAQAIKMGESK